MTAGRVSPSWLALREPADTAARAVDLVDELRRDLPVDCPLVVHDLACGTGSMLRWLAPRLPGPQHWICYDLDTDLLGIAADEQDRRIVDDQPITVEVRQRDVTCLARDECDGATLITTSALLDLLTAEELGRLVATIVDARCPALLTLTVTGRVELWPTHPLDTVVGTAFNAHQRRTSGGRLLGPDAADAVARAFRSSDYEVHVRTSTWRLGAAEDALTTAWFTGWLAAACEQRRELTTWVVGAYRRQRLADAAAGRLHVRVQHRDLLVRPSRWHVG